MVSSYAKYEFLKAMSIDHLEGHVRQRLVTLSNLARDVYETFDERTDMNLLRESDRKTLMEMVRLTDEAITAMADALQVSEEL